MRTNKSETSLKHRILLITLGLFITVLLAEALFRVAGLIAHKTMIQTNTKINETGIKILCLGDSSTFGIGASNADKYSYPIQLQKILDEKHPDMNFKVINEGIPSLNSSQLLNRLSNNLSKYNPDIVIVQIGENDYWNLEESKISEYYDVGFFRRLVLSLNLFLGYSKLYRFSKLVFISVDRRNYVVDNAHANTDPQFIKTEGKKYRFILRDPASTIAYSSLINDNFTKIVQIFKYHNVKIIFLRYHVEGYLSIHFYQEQIFNQLSVPYVNNRKLFLEAEERGINPFGPDRWHPGDTGYLLIARNIYNKMVELGFVQGNQIPIF